MITKVQHTLSWTTNQNVNVYNITTDMLHKLDYPVLHKRNILQLHYERKKYDKHN